MKRSEIALALFLTTWLMVFDQAFTTHRYSYLLKGFDSSKQTCSSVIQFETHHPIVQVFHHKHCDKFQHVLALTNQSQLFYLTFNRSNLARVHLVKDFNEDRIVKIEPLWNFERVYMLSESSGKFSIHEADLNLQIIARLEDFNGSNDSNVQLIPNPFQGTLTYSVNNYFKAINVIYPDLKPKKQQTRGSFQIVDYSNSYSDYALCDQNKYGWFEVIQSSTKLKGQKELETFFVQTSTGQLLDCSFYHGECACLPVDSISLKDKILKFNQRLLSPVKRCLNASSSFIEFEVDLDKRIDYSFNKTIEECMQVCSYANWEKELLANFNYEFPVRHHASCKNNLDLNSSLEDLGIALFYNDPNNRTTLNSTHYQLEIYYHKDFKMKLAPKCVNYELMYKYLVYYREHHEFKPVYDQKDYNTTSSFDARIYLTLDRAKAYEILIFIQTPFDPKPFLVGNYILNSNLTIPQNYTSPDFMIVPIKPNLNLFAPRWSYNVAKNAILASFFKYKNDSLIYDNIFYVLIDLDHQTTLVNKINVSQSLLTTDFHDNRFNQILFMIDGLVENTNYNLRIIEYSNETVSVSNSISFKTLIKPWFRIVSVGDESIELQCFMDCSLELVDQNLNHIEYKNENVCDSMKILIMDINSTNDSSSDDTWTIKYDKLIHETDFNRSAKSQNDSWLTRKIRIDGLRPLSDYLIKLDVETNFLLPEYKSMQSDILNFTTSQKILIKSNSLFYSKTFQLVLVSLFSALILAFFALMASLFGNSKLRKKLKGKSEPELDSASFLDNLNTNILYSVNNTEIKSLISKHANALNKIDESQVSTSKIIGRGAFGQVYKGRLKTDYHPEPIVVAVKKLKEDATLLEKLDLIKEAISLSSFDHPNLIKFYGACMDDDSGLKYIVIEYMNGGDLLSYLRASRTNNSFNYREAIKICIEIANGCAFLERMKIIHRDLAARNCLISIDASGGKIAVKLGDFGLARELYSTTYRQTNNDKLMPIRWMPPEAITDGIFTTKSDIWSFGVCVWEIFTLGYQPYLGMDNKQVIDYVKSGGILDVPQKCPTEIRAIMLDCWKLENKQRPTFEKILGQLISIAQDETSLAKNANSLPMFDDSYSIDSKSQKSKNLNKLTIKRLSSTDIEKDGYSLNDSFYSPTESS